MPLRLVDVQQSILRKNTTVALELRRRFEQSGTFVLNALSSPGSGKTTLVEETLKRLRPRYRVGALVGDQATENDAQRLARSGAAVRQISTGAECRLDAQMVTAAYDELLHCHREVSRRAPEGASVGEDRMSSRLDNDPVIVRYRTTVSS
jgi:hydrogenase accessory protein HypB